MLSSLLAAVMCTAIPAVDPLDVPARANQRDALIEVGIRLTETQFRARNYSRTGQVLLFKSSESSAVACRPLPAGAELIYSFPRHALEGVQLEVATPTAENSRGTRGWRGTGVVSLADVLARDADLLWVQSAGSRSIVWMQNGTELSLLQPQERILPRAARSDDDGFNEDPIPVPTHVPVITPSDTPKGDSPPKLEEEPLPPV